MWVGGWFGLVTHVLIAHTHTHTFELMSSHIYSTGTLSLLHPVINFTQLNSFLSGHLLKHFHQPVTHSSEDWELLFIQRDKAG